MCLSRAGSYPTVYEISLDIPRLQHPETMNSSEDYTRLLQLHTGVDLSTCRHITLDRRGDVVTYVEHLLDLSEKGKLPALEELQVATDRDMERRLVMFARYKVALLLCRLSELVCRTANSVQFRAVRLPSLRKLAMLNLFLPVLAEGLQTLELRRTTCSVIAAVPVLATVIGRLVKPSANSLRHLKLHRAVKVQQTSIDDVVSLPSLQSLCIGGSVSVVLTILRSLKLPDSVQMDMTIELEDRQARAPTVQSAEHVLSLLGTSLKVSIFASNSLQDCGSGMMPWSCATWTGRPAGIKTTGMFYRAASI